MKKIIVRFFTFVGILFIVEAFIVGFDFDSAATLYLFALILAITHLLLTPVIRFLTLPLNMLTYGLFTFIFSCCYIYFFDLLLPGLKIMNGHIGPVLSSAVQIPEIKLSRIGAIMVAALTISVLNGIVSWTQE